MLYRARLMRSREPRRTPEVVFLPVKSEMGPKAPCSSVHQWPPASRMLSIIRNGGQLTCLSARHEPISPDCPRTPLTRIAHLESYSSRTVQPRLSAPPP